MGRCLILDHFPKQLWSALLDLMPTFCHSHASLKTCFLPRNPCSQGKVTPFPMHVTLKKVAPSFHPSFTM